MAYDEARGVIVLLGGVDEWGIVGTRPEPFVGTWLFR